MVINFTISVIIIRIINNITTDDNKNYLDITYATDCRDTFYFQKYNFVNYIFFSKNKMYPCLFKYAFWTTETLNKRPFNV